MDTWFNEYVVAPLDELLDSVPIGDEVHDLDRCEKLAIGLEGLFRTEAAAQYQGWPPGSTTDGTRIDLCVRSDEDTLDVAGVAWIDCDGAGLPVSGRHPTHSRPFRTCHRLHRPSRSTDG